RDQGQQGDHATGDVAVELPVAARGRRAELRRLTAELRLLRATEPGAAEALRRLARLAEALLLAVPARLTRLPVPARLLAVARSRDQGQQGDHATGDVAVELPVAARGRRAELRRLTAELRLLRATEPGAAEALRRLARLAEALLLAVPARLTRLPVPARLLAVA